MKNNDYNFLKISPVSLKFKNNSIQASLSKDFSNIKPKVDNSNILKKRKQIII